MTNNSRIKNWLFAADLQYSAMRFLLFSIFAGIAGGLLSLYVYSSYAALHGGVDSAQAFERLMSHSSFIHALIMVLFVLMPALLGGFASLVVPKMVAAPRMAKPILSNIAFWLLPPALIILAATLVAPVGEGMRDYATILAIHLAGLSTLLISINLIATIIVMRSPDIKLMDMPPFVWSILIAASLFMIAVPLMSVGLSAALLSTADEALLWFFAHAEIYILIIPAIGIVTQIISTFTRPHPRADKVLIWVMMLSGLAGLIFWCETIFAAQPNFSTGNYYLTAFIIIGLPLIAVFLYWLGALLSVNIFNNPVLLWIGGFMIVSVVGAFMAIASVVAFLADTTSDAAVFSAHFHYILSLSSVFAIFAAWYYWFPTLTSRQIAPWAGKLHFWMMFIGINAMFLPMYFHNDTDQMMLMRVISSAGILMTFLSLVFFVVVLFATLRYGRKAERQPWGVGAQTLEWYPQDAAYNREASVMLYIEK